MRGVTRTLFWFWALVGFVLATVSVLCWPSAFRLATAHDPCKQRGDHGFSSEISRPRSLVSWPVVWGDVHVALRVRNSDASILELLEDRKIQLADQHASAVQQP